ncbi:MAG: substrate-binding domain-containing protein [Phycisphaerae bacterium]
MPRPSTKTPDVPRTAPASTASSSAPRPPAALPRRRVALIVETSNEYARGLLHGIRAYIREHPHWDIDLDERRRGEATGWLRDFHGDGVIARIENPAIAAEVLAAKVPCVDVSAARQVPGIPWVETDDAEIARLAFDHLAERGIRSFAFCPAPEFNWSEWRQTRFETLCAAAGAKCAVYSPPAGKVLSHDEQLESLAAWLKGLPKPLGVMAAYDITGRQLLAAAKLADLPVPDEVAVVGVDNDELLCDLSDPPLTSVAPDTDATGYLAAQLLDRMMGGHRVAATAHLVKPIGVIPRGSTDTLAVADERIAAAVRYIRAHACDGINVSDVLEHVDMSRRVFETLYRKTLGRMPHEEIVRTRIARVKDLLSQTDLPLHEVARRTGFKHVEYMSVVFKKKTGLPPSHYRDKRGS